MVFDLPCKHAQHQACVKPWFAKRAHCPECRSPTKTEEDSEQAAVGQGAGDGVGAGSPARSSGDGIGGGSGAGNGGAAPSQTLVVPAGISAPVPVLPPFGDLESGAGGGGVGVNPGRGEVSPGGGALSEASPMTPPADGAGMPAPVVPGGIPSVGANPI